MSTLLQYAEEYAEAGVAPLAVLPGSKVAACNWSDFQIVAPTPEERKAMFSGCDLLNVAFTCGTPSGNLFGVDAETPTAFADALKGLDRVGLTDTWIDETPRGGRIWLRSSVPLRSQKGKDIEVLGQGKYGLTYPSRFGIKDYHRLHHPPAVLTVTSLDALREALPWFDPKEAVISSHDKKLPRKAKQLLHSQGTRAYRTRSEAEQAIITSLYGAGFEFGEVLALFRRFPAAGKFASMKESLAITYLRRSYEQARKFHEKESPYRTVARSALLWAASIPWPGQTGSTSRAVFCAHASLAFLSGKVDYGASARDLSEHAGCQRITAQKATRRLRQDGLIELTKPFTYFCSNRYALTVSDEKGKTLHHSLTTTVGGVVQSMPFSQSPLHDAFRRRGLGRSACEVLGVLGSPPLTADEIAKKTGRHVKTVRGALKRLRAMGFTTKEGKRWTKAETQPDLDAVACAVGTAGCGVRQKRRHKAERLHRRVMAGVYRIEHGGEA